MMGDDDKTARPDGARQEGSCSFGVFRWDPSYVRDEWAGRLKVAEAIATLLAGAILPPFFYGHGGVFTFFDFVVWTSFINILIDLFLHLFSAWNRIIYICRAPEVYVVLCTVACFSFLLSSALLAGYSRYSYDSTRAGISAFFGFLCMCMFAVEAYFIHLATYRRGKMQNVRQEEPDEFAEPV